MQAAREAYQIAVHALEKGIGEVTTPEQAEKILDELERAAQNLTEGDLQDAATFRSPQERAQSIERAVDRAPLGERSAAAIKETARQLAATPLEERAFLDEAIGEATGVEGFRPGHVLPSTQVRRGRRILRTALFKRMKPFAAVDAVLFIQINHLPHPRLVDGFLTRLSWIMTSGIGWISVLVAMGMQDRKRGTRAALGVLPALWVAVSTVEFGIKAFFRRRRPFLSLMRAIVVGRKPGSYSFPSGHSAAAFAGASLLCCHYPRLRPLFYTIAGLTGFSRVYLGAHFPGDVIVGGVVGTFLARVFRSIFRWLARRFLGWGR